MAFLVKSFGMEIRPLHTMQELQGLDEEVNSFLAAQSVKRVVSVADSQTTDDNGETIGIIRVIAYEV